MLVVSPVNGRVPLEVYLPGTHKAPRGARRRSSEIAVLGLIPRGPGDADDPPRPPSAPAPPGFAEVERVETDTYTLVRLPRRRAGRRPRRRSTGMALGGAEAELVVQPPRR